MTKLEEIRALVARLQVKPVVQWRYNEGDAACKAINAMLPVVEAARAYFGAIDAANVEHCKEPPSAHVDPFMQALAEQGRTFHLLESAVRAFAHPETETERTEPRE